MKLRLIISYAPAGGMGPISTANLKRQRTKALQRAARGVEPQKL